MTPRAITAGVWYFAAVFAAGFVLGVARTLVLEPRLGEVRAVLLEIPFMLALSWWVAGRVVSRRVPPLRMSERVAMGATALVLLWAAEAGTLALVGTPPRAILAAFTSGAGLIGVASQLVFAAMPLFVDRRRRQRA